MTPEPQIIAPVVVEETVKTTVVIETIVEKIVEKIVTNTVYVQSPLPDHTLFLNTLTTQVNTTTCDNANICVNE